MRLSHLISVVILAAALGLFVFGYLARQATTLTSAREPQAMERFTEVRSRFAGTASMLDIDDKGRVTRSPGVERSEVPEVETLWILVFRAQDEELVETKIPFWFVKLKGPALQFLMRGTGVYFKPLGITTKDLEKHGPGLVLDQIRGNGDQVLVWMD